MEHFAIVTLTVNTQRARGVWGRRNAPSCGWSALYCLPPGATECGDATSVDCIACGMPSWAAQQLSLFATLVLVHANQFEARALTFWHTLALTLFVALGSYSYVHFHMNSVEQVGAEGAAPNPCARIA